MQASQRRCLWRGGDLHEVMQNVSMPRQGVGAGVATAAQQAAHLLIRIRQPVEEPLNLSCFTRCKLQAQVIHQRLLIPAEAFQSNCSLSPHNQNKNHFEWIERLEIELVIAHTRCPSPRGNSSRFRAAWLALVPLLAILACTKGTYTLASLQAASCSCLNGGGMKMQA